MNNISQVVSQGSSLDKPELVHEERVEALNKIGDVNDTEISLNQLLQDNPIPYFSKERIRLYLTMGCIYFISTSNGYDSSLLTSIITLDEFQDHFNLSGSPASTGLVFSIYPIGAMCASTLVWLGDYIGRVYTIAFGLVLVVVGGIMSATTSSFKVFIGARFILALINVSTSIAPAYLMEITPPNLKTLALFYNTFYFIGSIIATWTTYGTKLNYSGSQETFLIPLWLQILCPGIVLCCIWTFPESPRYLYSKGNIDKCKEFIIKFHAGGDANHPVVMAEMHQIAESFRQSGFLKPKDYFDFSVFFRTKAQRKRTIIVVIWSWFCQFSGNQVVSYYMTTLFLNLGITNATTRLLLTAINSIISLCFAVAGAYLVESLGRRPMLMYANAGFVVCFAVLTGCTKAFQDDPNNLVAARAGIAFIYIFGAVFFSFAITPLQPIYPAELLSNETRARGMALWHLISNAASVLNLYTAPIAMANIKSYYYLFFTFWDLFQLIVIYFVFVETSHLSLEEIEYVFKVPHPVQESIRLSKAAKRGEKFQIATEEEEIV